MTTLILRHEEIIRLIEADWFEADAPIRLETGLPLSALGDARLVQDARRVMSGIHEEGGVLLTAKGNLNRKFVAAMARALRRPETDTPFSGPDAVFRLRVLRTLEWFSLVRNMQPDAREWAGETTLWRKTPLYDRFFSFDVDAAWR